MPAPYLYQSDRLSVVTEGDPELGPVDAALLFKNGDVRVTHASALDDGHPDGPLLVLDAERMATADVVLGVAQAKIDAFEASLSDPEHSSPSVPEDAVHRKAFVENVTASAHVAEQIGNVRPLDRFSIR